MPGLAQRDRHVRSDRGLFVIINRREEGDRLFDVVLRVKGADRMGRNALLFRVTLLLAESRMISFARSSVAEVP